MKQAGANRTTWIRRLAAAVFLLNLIAVTWPGVTLFRAAEPRWFGLPLSMAWPIAWIVVGWITLLILDHFEQAAAARREADHRGDND